MAAKPYALAVDIGTSSVRAIAFGADGKVAARRQRQYGTIRPKPYFEEQDPDLVRNAVYGTVAELMASGDLSPAQVGCLCFSSQMYGIFPVDAEGRAIGNNILWSDGRAEPQADRMKREFGPLGLYPETGCPMNSIYPIAKLAWLREERPELFGQAARFCSIKEYVVEPLIAEWAVDYSMASSTGLFDIRRHIWHQGALAAAGVMASRLSAPVSGLERFALKAGSPLSATGLPIGLPVFLGGGDGPLANLGSGASGVGSVNIDLGTSGAARVISDAAVTDADASLWCFCLTDALWAYGGIVTNVGNAYQWLANALSGASGMSDESSYESLNRLAAEAGPGADGLIMVPYLRKARSPYWDGRIRSTLYGLTADHGLGHMARALLEAVAFDLKTIIALMAARVAVAPHAVLTGGLARSPLIPQLLADVLEREIRAPEEGEGSIAGAAIMGLYGIGELKALAFEGGPTSYKAFLPQAELGQVYRTMHQRFIKTIKFLQTINFDDEGGCL